MKVFCNFPKNHNNFMSISYEGGKNGVYPNEKRGCYGTCKHVFTENCPINIKHIIHMSIQS